MVRWNDSTKRAVWLGESPDFQEFRIDDYGRWMRYTEFGNRQSKYGWEIDHRFPHGKGGSNDVTNLRPLNWKSNVERNKKSFENAELGMSFKR